MLFLEGFQLTIIQISGAVITMYLLLEADEYDRSFLQLSPDVALISAMDADHLDIYGTKEKMEHSFVEFSERLREPVACY